MVMVTVKCNDKEWYAPYANERTEECTIWLTENVGERWHKWTWSTEFGYVILPEEDAVIFKLMFGV
jgi:uncharacterized protein (DUF4213/DUF364 family)